MNAQIDAIIEPFDWRRPDYGSIHVQRIERLRRIRANPDALPRLREFYRDHPAQFISDWGVTLDPRNVERGVPARVPFVLFQRQVECVNWIIERWRHGEPGLIEKSRDSGMSWLTVALACTLCLFHEGLVVGFGSRKEAYVDSIGDPKSLFYKAREFLDGIPAEFLGGWNRDRHAPSMRILFPATGSSCVGESGDGIGRGARTSLFFVDESAFIERPELIDASLAGTTNCRVDVSTPNGMNNSFAQKRHGGKIKVFTLHWREDPRKDDAWFEKQQRELDPVTLASEVMIDYSASIRNILIPRAWVESAIDAHVKLGITPTGVRRGGLDVADEGRDLCAFAGRHGILLEHLCSWSGKDSDIYKTTVRAFHLADEYGYQTWDFDSDGLGAGVRGDAERINEDRAAANVPTLRVYPYRGSGAVWDPDREVVPGSGRLNVDFFQNQKAQAWWHLRYRFQQTYRAVSEGLKVDPDDVISISSKIGELGQLTNELSQVQYKLSNTGKVQIEKAPDGMRSPNLADAVVIAFCPATHGMETWLKIIDDLG